MLPYVVSDNSVTVYTNDGPVTVHDSQPNYADVMLGVRKRDEAFILANLTVGHKVVSKYAKSGKVETVDNQVIFNGKALDNATTEHILRMLSKNLPVDAELKFLEKLMENPSRRVIMEFNDFMNAAKLPITTDGNFRAYKVISSNWTDKHTGRFDNRVGKTVEVPRNEVDDDSTRECSYGLHFCGYEYTKYFYNTGDRIVEVEINPRDVVAFPSDHNRQKGRCCRYTVVRELPVHEDVLTDLGVRDYEEPAESDWADDTTYKSDWKDGYDAGYVDGVNDAGVRMNRAIDDLVAEYDDAN